jgi:hypothetical protein
MNTHSNPSRRILRAAFLTLTISALPLPAFGYGDAGHQTVGAIADRLIAGSPNTVAHVHALIGNETLEHTATWADTAKHPGHNPTAEMQAFIAANPHLSPTPGPHDQNSYHFTDMPFQETHYRAGSVGASKIDVVHMIRNCIAILEGHSTATNNPTGIPPQTALRLLVHYVGDIHQPLHVGAAYFGPNAQPVNPNTSAGSNADQGGNLISFHDRVLNKDTKLHSYWDTPTVRNAMAAANVQTPGAFAQVIVATPPQGWDSGPFMSGWPVKWANEMLPIAAQAHNKLTFTGTTNNWTAQSNDLAGYDQWAAAQVRTEIARAGFRLAAILKKIWP